LTLESNTKLIICNALPSLFFVKHPLILRVFKSVTLLSLSVQVMPPLWCRFDRMWFGHPGIMEGTITRQPFVCPMDHVFEVFYFENQLVIFHG